MNLLKDLKFPAFKNSIVDHVRKATKDSDIISLFESLDGYIKYKDQYHEDICRFIQHLHTDRSGCSCVYTAGTNNVSEW